MRHLAALLSLTILPFSALPAKAAEWQIDPEKSTVRFTGLQDGQAFTVTFPSFTARVRFDPAALADTHIDVILPVSTLTTDNQTVQGEIAKPEWFNADAFPEATYTAGTVRKIDDTHFEAVGELTLRGVTKPLVLPFTFTEANGTAAVTASVTLLRNDFGIGQDSWATDTSVGQEVRVEISLEAARVSYQQP